MKKLFLLLFLTSCITSVQAQIAWNIRAGAGFSDLICKGSRMGSQFAYKAGLGTEYAIWRRNLLVMGAVEYAHKGSQCKDSSGMTYKLAGSHYAQIPLMIAGRINYKNFNATLKGGGYGSYAFASDKDALTNDKFDYGYVVSLDIEYLHFVLGVDYQRGLKNMIDDKYYKAYNSALYFNIGCRF